MSRQAAIKPPSLWSLLDDEYYDDDESQKYYMYFIRILLDLGMQVCLWLNCSYLILAALSRQRQHEQRLPRRIPF